MNKEYIIQLTKNLYNITLLFPKKEPLRYKMRESANDILADLTLTFRGETHKSQNLFPEIEKNLEIMNSFFEVAKGQNWISLSDILAVQNQYVKLGEEFQKIRSEREEEKVNYASVINPLLNELKPQMLLQRQQRILELLKDKGRAQVWEVKQVFPEVTKRTLRRDFEKLLTQGLIERGGERNETFYRLKS